MKYDFLFTHQSDKFLRKNKGYILRDEVENKLISAVKKITKEEDNSSDIKQLHGEWSGYFRLRIREIRVIFTFERGEITIVEVEKIEHRGDVY